MLLRFHPDGTQWEFRRNYSGPAPDMAVSIDLGPARNGAVERAWGEKRFSMDPSTGRILLDGEPMGVTSSTYIIPYQQVSDRIDAIAYPPTEADVDFLKNALQYLLDLMLEFGRAEL